MKEIGRRDFLRYSGMGVATIIITACGGSGGGGDAVPGGGGGGTPPPVSATLNFSITDIIKEMHTHEAANPLAGPAECYYWVFKEARFPADNPAPQIFATEGDRVVINVTNNLNGPHAFFIPGMADTGPIAPGASAQVDFIMGAPGTYLYYDNLNAPVNRVMGLHGALVVMPRAAAAGHKLNPYGASVTPGVQALFDDFGSTPWWPGLSWEQGDPTLPLNPTPPTRQHIWLCHQSSPVLFEEVGLFAQNNPGVNFNAQTFVNAFIADPFVGTSTDPRAPGLSTVHNRKPQFFTINGQSGHFAHNHGLITPMYRVGEPTLVRLLNAGLWTHSMHLHANHFFVTAVDNVPQENPIWLDVFNLLPMRHVDYVVPFMRPPDIPNTRGIGRADAGLPTANGTPAWPPVEEFGRHHPEPGTIIVTNFLGTGLVDLEQRQSPLCYPMHDHSEPTQTSQGGNYNTGLISGMYILGDRNGLMNFPIDADFQMMLDLGRSTSATGPAAGNPPE
jgi:hypothetical protein